MANKNGVHHVLIRPLEYGEGKSYCGRTVRRHDIPIEIDHAKACIEQWTWLQPCKKCMKAYYKQEIKRISETTQEGAA